MKFSVFGAILLTCVLSFASFAFAQSPNGRTPSPPGAKVEFIDLKDGAVIGPTTTIHFGLHGMGVAPAGEARPNSGHHHLLIDTDLPPFDQPIPSDENHLHFGAGQTETELTLTPGPHTLQLLFGDYMHVPHDPPVYSEKIHVIVKDTTTPTTETAPTTPAPTIAERHKSPPGALVYIVSPENGAYVPNTFVVRFGLEKMGVAPAGVDTPNTGHHHLIIDASLPAFDQPVPNDENHMHFGEGQTETTLTLPTGKHTLQLLFADGGHVPHNPPVYSKQITVFVGMTPPHPIHHRRRPPRAVGGGYQ